MYAGVVAWGRPPSRRPDTRLARRPWGRLERGRGRDVVPRRGPAVPAGLPGIRGLIQYIEQPWPPQFFLELHIRFVATESAAQPSTVARLRPRPRLRPHLGGHPGHPGSSTAGHPATPMRGILQRPAILMMGARTPGGSAAAAAAAGSTPAERFSDRSAFVSVRAAATAPPPCTDLPGWASSPGSPAQPGLVSTPVSITLPALPTITAPATPTLTSPPNVESTPAQAAVTTTPVRGPPAQPPRSGSPGVGRGCYPGNSEADPGTRGKPRGPRLPPRKQPPARVSYSELHRLAALAAGIHPLVMPTTPSAVAPTPAFTAPDLTTPAAAYPSSITTPHRSPTTIPLGPLGPPRPPLPPPSALPSRQVRPIHEKSAPEIGERGSRSTGNPVAGRRKIPKSREAGPEKEEKANFAF
ncbi:hypothetical protein PAPYR_13032 [Paratrimastix pyriformis]|uniref:Uncharacterized protein n=1 Tax=Paratrimastix pyriformis TaxID=342808 RepID=A0ABQ8U4H9_9EUKA|nr:hypothetical protein PAPYR_13032 [Paratrimastix pyriformis]